LQELLAWWAPSCGKEEKNILASLELFGVALLYDVKSLSFLVSKDALFL
jgi:hypothetical protein